MVCFHYREGRICNWFSGTLLVLFCTPVHLKHLFTLGNEEEMIIICCLIHV